MSPTLKLRRLVLSNFGPFVGDHELELPENGLHMVFGENQDTDESSGAGKSSLVEALAYAFDYSTFAATELQSWEWLTKEPMSVEVDFSAPAGDVALRRGKKAALTIAGKDPVTSAKSVKEAMGHVVGVRPEILKALTYRPQGQPGLFLAMTDQEKKSFLTELLGLQVYEAEADVAVKVISALEEELKAKDAVAQAMKAQVPPEPTPLPALDLSEVDQKQAGINDEIEKMEAAFRKLKDREAQATADINARVEEVNRKWSPYIDNLAAAASVLETKSLLIPPLVTPESPPELADLRKKLDLLRQGIRKTKESHQAKLSELRTGIASERNEMHRLRSHAQSQARVANAELTRLKDEVEVLEKQECDRCHRPWSDEEHARVLADKRGGIERCKVALKAAEEELEQAAETERWVKEKDLELTFAQDSDPVPEKLAKGEQEYAQKVAQVEADWRSALANAQRAHNDQVQVLRAQKQAEVAQAKTTLAKAENDYMSALHKAHEMTSEHVSLRDTLAKTKEMVNALWADSRVCSERAAALRQQHADRSAAFKRELDAWSNAVERYTKAGVERERVAIKLDQENDYLACIRSFLGVIFDETLNRVAHLTNERLARVPNVQGLTLRFVSERETKTTKNMRQEIRPIVERDGHEIPLKRTSGGQYTAVELAVDLSLADVIAERTGVMPGWLVLDEAFNGLPVKSKTSCLELLKDAAATRLILVIDHATEVKEYFDSEIVVRSKDGRSTFA